MRTTVLALAAWGLTLTVAWADEPKKDNKDLVKVIDLKGAELEPVEHGLDKATEIDRAADLAKVFAKDEALQARLRKEIDFSKQKLVYFAWSGSGGDKLDFLVAAGKDVRVLFMLQPGRTRDLRQHFALYAMPQSAVFAIKGVNIR